ncbi:hypothetical protein EYF80_060542 [Liparis tanakae]|uniref:Uncharacterized protein n=1 Tax=Liparis tanakae TaxID=230148 RepID=A0A4Z2EKI0_9TELE|nr:hypothetical protein EYF80_060542 [Liparis tanakae]
MQMSETIAQNACISQNDHKIVLWRNERLKKDICQLKAKLRAMTEDMKHLEGNDEHQKQMIWYLEQPVDIPENTCTINENKVTITEESQKIQLWSDTMEALDNNDIQSDNDLNRELKSENHRLTLENEKLRSALKKDPSDQKMLRIYEDKTEKLKKDLWKWKEKAKAAENALARTQLHTAKVNNKDQLETIASLNETIDRMALDLKMVRKTLQELEGARLDLEKKTCTIEKQNIELENITREKQAEENNKLQLEQEETSLVQAIESLQQPEISNRPRTKKWYQCLFPGCGRQKTTD